jgi:type I restriction enzyme R subunit
VDYTEVFMNAGIREKELPEKFAGGQYRVLIVAEKYQTGFDQPLLHTMYVDKKLAGVHAVQTLCRLNRTMSGKSDTFILDFVNEAEDIQEAFEPYYVATGVGERVDPAQLEELKERIFAFQVFSRADVEDFAAVFFRERSAQTGGDQPRLNALLDKAVSEWRLRSDEEREEVRSLLMGYRNLYSFASQIMPWVDAELEKLYAYVRFLLRKLPPRSEGQPQVDLDDEVALKAYRLEMTAEDRSMSLSGEPGEIDGPVAVGTGADPDEDETPLSELVKMINERFGIDWQDGDQLFVDAVVADMSALPEMILKARANDFANFSAGFGPAVEGAMIERMEQNGGIVGRFLDEPEFGKLLSGYMARRVYEDAREAGADVS